MTGTAAVYGSMQAGSGNLVQMAGGALTYSAVYAAVPNVASLVVPAGTGAVSGVIVIEAQFGPAGAGGAKEIVVDEVVLTRA